MDGQISIPSHSEHQAVALGGPCRRKGEREQYIPCGCQEGGTWTSQAQISILILKIDQEEGTYRHCQVCRGQSKQCKVGWEQATGSSAEVLRKSSKSFPFPPENNHRAGGEGGDCRERMLHSLRAAEKQDGSYRAVFSYYMQTERKISIAGQHVPYLVPSHPLHVCYMAQAHMHTHSLKLR